MYHLVFENSVWQSPTRVTENVFKLGSGWVGSSYARIESSYAQVGLGPVMLGSGRVGSGHKKLTHVGLWCLNSQIFLTEVLALEVDVFFQSRR
jgi:hypothetical protein